MYVPEVIREPRMCFQKVPRLGAFMAVPLCYNSCLFDEALEAAVHDKIDCMRRVEEQTKERTEYYDGFNARKETALANGEPFEEEEREWEVIDVKPFITQEEKWVVMLDTLG